MRPVFISYYPNSHHKGVYLPCITTITLSLEKAAVKLNRESNLEEYTIYFTDHAKDQRGCFRHAKFVS